MNKLLLSATAAITLLGIGAGSLQASPFTFDWGETTKKLYFNGASSVKSAYGSLSSNTSAHDVSITTNVAANFANGFANVKPSGTIAISSLTFTPLTAKIDAFSFRGQLKSSPNATYTVLVSVLDNNNITFSHVYSYDNPAHTNHLFQANQDFNPLRVFSNMTGEWIKSVTVSTQYGFKEEKQNEFNLYDPSNPGGGGTASSTSIPEPVFIQLSTLLIFGGLGLRLRR